MQNQRFVWPWKVISTLPLLVLLHVSIGCNGQVPPGQKPEPGKTTVDSAAPKKLPELPLPTAYVKENEDPTREGGYVFVDAKGKEIAFLSEKELANRNPYLKNSLPPWKEEEGEDFYNQFKGLSPEEIKRRLPQNLKSLPSDKILKNAGVIYNTLKFVGYNPENPQFLIASYAIEIYDKHSLEQAWVETTIHIYDKRGKLKATIVDSHNIQSAFISSDGKYILAAEILGRIGDGVSEEHTGLIVYDVKNEKLISTLRGRLLHNYNDISVLDGKFGLYGSYLKNFIIGNDHSDYITMKFIIDPAQRIVYQKAFNFYDKPEITIPNTSKSFDLKSEDLSTYEVFHF